MTDEINAHDQHTTGELAAALAAFQEVMPRITKDETAEVPTKNGGSYSYSYADLAAISRQVYPLLAAQGLAFTAFPTLVGGQFVMRYSLLHRSGERLDGIYPIQGGTAQAIGSAITYARRYCLCAVTGVAADDDDDAAAAQAAQERTPAPADPERASAIAAVGSAWVAQYGGTADGSPNWREIGEAYVKWSGGTIATRATPAELRNYAAYLSALPPTAAGEAPPGAPDHRPAPADEAMMSPRQRGMLFALLGEIGLHDKDEQLRWMNTQLHKEYESRSLLTFSDAKLLIDSLQKGVDVGG